MLIYIFNKPKCDMEGFTFSIIDTKIKIHSSIHHITAQYVVIDLLNPVCDLQNLQNRLFWEKNPRRSICGAAESKSGLNQW